ncbi:MAG: hypothetical protein QG657_2037, partial [Acidobacteriota bacterium]|nr:hypothetical protein [Acidobacteriota bacterium]
KMGLEKICGTVGGEFRYKDILDLSFSFL